MTAEPPPNVGPVDPVVMSFDDFYREQYRPMVRLAYLLVGSQEAAEDCVQEAFMRLHRAWDRVSEPGPYLRTAVVNVTRDGGRRRSRLGDRWPALRREASAAASPLRSTTAHDRIPESLAIADALRVLPERHREAIVLRYYADQSEAAIAESLGVAPGTVKSLIHRGLIRLRQEMQS